MTDAATSGGGDFAALAFPTLDGRGQAAQRSSDDRARVDERARARGHAAGYAEGLRAASVAVAGHVAELHAGHATMMLTATQDLSRALAVLHTAARALDQRTVPVQRDVEDTLLCAAIDLAEAIIGHALADEAAAVRFALGRSGQAATGGSASAPHSVRLHPDDLALLDSALRDPALPPAATPGQRLSVPASVTLVADASLARGDAVSEFPDGYLDARIGSALERARTALGQVTT